MRENPPKNKILVVGRRGVGKLSLVHAILSSRFIPTTSVSRSRPASPLLLPVTTIPSLEESQTFDGPSHHIRHGREPSIEDHTGQAPSSSTPPSPPSLTLPSTDAAESGSSATFDPTTSVDMAIQTTTSTTNSTATTTNTTKARSRVDHSGVTIPWTIDTKYYTVKVDFWIDETDPKGHRELERMMDAGDLDEIGAVVEAVVFCFSRNDPSTFHDIKPWITFAERMDPAITLCVATDAPMQPKEASSQLGVEEEDEGEAEIHEEITDYNEWCLSNGFEYVDLQEDTEGLGADEHVGLDRILEALAAHMWDGLKRKSNKKQGQHTRNMIRSFSVDPDGNESSSTMMLDILASQQSHVSREYLEKLANMTSEHPGGLLDPIREGHDREDDEGDEDEDDEDDEDDDEDDDRAFYRALAELSLQNRALSPLTTSAFQREHRSYDADVDEEDTTGEDPWSLQHSGDLEADMSHGQAGGSAAAAVSPGQTIGTRRYSRTASNRDSVTMQDLLAQDQERQAEYFLKKPFVEAAREEEEQSGEEGGGLVREAGGDIGASRAGGVGLESEFLLQADGRFDFGDYMTATGGGDVDFENEFMTDPAFDDVPPEMVEEMHQTLFANMDDEDGMARTLETLRGLREQGKNMPDKERRELAARVALSFGMQMDK